MIIEPMTEADLAEVLAIDLASFPASQRGAAPDGVREARERQLREELARPWARLRVARAGDGREILGYILSWHVVDELHLLDVAVARAERRRGLGRALVRDLLAYAAESAAGKVLLEVRASNQAAIALYEGLGFEHLGVRAGYYADGEDALEMILRRA